jgi:hypothetical protein
MRARDPSQRAFRCHVKSIFIHLILHLDSFAIELENQALGKIVGGGVINDKVIGWEFRMPELGFEGFEFYERQEDDSYLMHAEYTTSDQFRTLIKGRVWQPIKPSKVNMESNE